MNEIAGKTSSSPEAARPSAHFIGICGKAMGGIAAALASDGWRVTGSDEKCYEPMKGYLESRGVVIRTPYQPENTPPDADYLVVGKRVAESNPELTGALARGGRHYSFPQFLRAKFLGRSRNAVVAGGLGKTTTTSMLAWILEDAGCRPDYLIGGQANNFTASARFEGSEFTVLEGDEYSSCFDDPTPKFLHYQPETAIITNVVEDHPDRYRDFEELWDVFAAMAETLPARGLLIISDQDAASQRLAARAKCAVASVGIGEGASQRITEIRLSPDRSGFRLGGEQFEIPVCGGMNIRNAAMAALAAAHFGISLRQSALALQRFRGVHNRQEEMQAGGCTLIFDKATHPLALAELASAVRQRFPGRRLVSVIQPRATGGKGWIYQRDLPAALAGFDQVILTSPYEHSPQQAQRWTNDPFSLDLLASSLVERNGKAAIVRSMPELQETLRKCLRNEDVVVVTVLEQSKALLEMIVSSVAGR